MNEGDLARLSFRMIEYFRGDQKRVHHALKVHGFARQIALAGNLPSKDRIILEAAACLHDIGIPRAEEKYGSSAGPYQEELGPPVAAEILKDFPLTAGDRERILFLIGHHHSYNAVDGPDFQILIEADFLVNMYEDDMTGAQIAALGRKIFKTDEGRLLLDSLSQ